MSRVVLDGFTLAYERAGEGDAIVFIHGALIADAFRPLLASPRSRWASAGRVSPPRLCGSTHAAGAITVAQHAADCRALLKHLGIVRAHVAGHSYGGAVALQLALDSPELVASLALLEPAVFGGQAYLDALSRGQERSRREGAEVVIDDFLKARFGANYRPQLDRVLPGSFAQAVADAATWFEQEIPGLRAWTSTIIRRSGSRNRSWLCSAGKATHMGSLWRDASAGSIVVAQCRGCRHCRCEPRDVDPGSRCGRRVACHVLPAPSNLPLTSRQCSRGFDPGTSACADHLTPRSPTSCEFRP